MRTAVTTALMALALIAAVVGAGLDAPPSPGPPPSREALRRDLAEARQKFRRAKAGKAPGPHAMTSSERQRLLAHLEMTESWLADEVGDLSTEQLKFRAAPGTWTIADVVEHLAVAEPQYWEHLQASLSTPPGEVRPQATDAGILWYGIDRTDRARTGEAREPAGRFKDVNESLAAFRKLRGTMREYARGSQDDLRGRMLKDGNMDVYQWFLMISAHSQRHILQIREIKAHKDWPTAEG